MKRAFVFLLAVLFSATVFGQTTEYSVQLGSGFFSFRGPDAVTSSFYNANTASSGYTNNPYGRGSAFSYGIALQFQRVTKKHFIYGILAGFESLSSSVKIDDVFPPYYNPLSTAVYLDYLVKNGSRTILTNEFVTLHPFVGVRLKVIQAIKTDLTFGTDFAFCTSSEEKATVRSEYGNFDTKTTRTKPHLDSRLRIDLNNYYKHIGLIVGYSYGLTNYESGMNGASAEVYSQMIRLGLVFKL